MKRFAAPSLFPATFRSLSLSHNPVSLSQPCLKRKETLYPLCSSSTFRAFHYSFISFCDKKIVGCCFPYVCGDTEQKSVPSPPPVDPLPDPLFHSHHVHTPFFFLFRLSLHPFNRISLVVERETFLIRLFLGRGWSHGNDNNCGGTYFIMFLSSKRRLFLRSFGLVFPLLSANP